MALEGFENEVKQVDREEVIFCAVCGQPEEEVREHVDCAECGHSKEHAQGEPCENCGETEEVTRTVTAPPQGYAPVRLVGNYWHKVGDSLCCSVRCALDKSGYDEEHDEYHAALDAVTPTEILTEEQVAAMPAASGPGITIAQYVRMEDFAEFDPESIAEEGS